MKIVIENLSKNYATPGAEVQVFSDLNLTLSSGSFASLTGSSGAGKSTLLHLLGTLDRQSSGSIRLDGADPQSLSATEIASFRNTNIGFVFQFHHLLPEFSALENVMIPLLVNRQSSSVAEVAGRNWLARVGLSHRINHKPGELSGGEQQRVALARALVNEPKMLLADEPTGNLDEETGQSIMDLLAEVQQERSITVLIVTHNMKLAQRATTRLQLKKEGLLHLAI